MLRKFGTGMLAMCMAAGLSMVACSDDDSGAVCGDGITEGSEVCDTDDVGAQTCSDEGFVGGTLSCNATCDGYDTSMCNNDVCGDDEVTGAEECDNANLDNTDCTDLGYDGGTLACTGTCMFDESGCTDACTDDCTADGDTQCTGDVLNTCTVGADGCLDWVDTDCTATMQICDDSGATAICADDCTSDCPAIGDTECIDATTINTCTDSGNGCMNWVASACAGGYCDDLATPPVCATQGGGDTCADAIVINQFPATIDGTDFTVDFPNDDHDFGSGTDCSSVSSSGGGIDAVFQVNLQAGDELYASDAGGIDFVIHIVTADATDCLNLGACLDSIDFGETTGAYYATATAETVYVVYEKWSGSSTTNDYAITINKISAVCGDGHVSPNEACDDGNTTAGDGCDATCANVETGYECMPGFCYAAGAGDVCATPIPLTAPITIGVDTTGFTDDYGVDVNVDYTACGGAGGFGPDVVFSVDVPAGDVLDASIINQDFNAAVVIATDCADIEGSCVIYDEGSSSQLDAAWYNDTGATATVFVLAESGNGGSAADGMLALGVNVYTPVTTCGDGTVEVGEGCDDGNTIAGDGCDASCAVESGFDCGGAPSFCYATGTGDVCGSAIPLTAPASLSFDTSTFTDDYGVDVGTNYTACGGDGGYGPDAVFSIDVPDGDVLTATLDNQSFTAALVFSPDCATVEASCAFYEEGSSSALNGVWANTTGATVTVYIVVDSGYSFSSQSGTFDLDVDVVTPVCGNGTIEPGEECDDGNTTAGDGCDASCQVEWFVCGAGETRVTVVSTDVPLTIADNSSQTSTLTVTNTGTITAAMLTIGDLQHNWDSDVDIFLLSPSSTTVEISTDNGSSGDNYVGTLFQDSCSAAPGAGSITSGSAPFTGCYAPEGSLASLNGEAANGVWTLQVDDDAAGIAGTLNSWTLDLCVQ